MILLVVPQIKTRHSIEHCTLHADGARQHFTGLSYSFIMIKLYLLPISMEEVAFHFNLQQPINLKWYECKTSLTIIIMSSFRQKEKDAPPLNFFQWTCPVKCILQNCELNSKGCVFNYWMLWHTIENGLCERSCLYVSQSVSVCVCKCACIFVCLYVNV